MRVARENKTKDLAVAAIAAFNKDMAGDHYWEPAFICEHIQTDQVLPAPPDGPDWDAGFEAWLWDIDRLLLVRYHARTRCLGPRARAA